MSTIKAFVLVKLLEEYNHILYYTTCRTNILSYITLQSIANYRDLSCHNSSNK